MVHRVKHRVMGFVMFFAIAVYLLILPFVKAHKKQEIFAPQQSSARPNIVLILTDDQDLRMDSLSYMPLLKQHLIDEGTFYTHHYCTVAICCPSRVNLWTGRAAHNTNVTDLSPPYGGYPKFISQGLNKAYLPVWLQESGYNTYYTGKFMNTHTINNYNKPFPAGWTGSDFLLDPYTYSYLNSTYQRNQDAPVSYEGQHSSDVLTSKAYGFLDEAFHSKEPFFLALAPIAPHTNMEFTAENLKITAPIPAKRHQHLFQGVKVPRTPNFNPSKPSSVNWIRSLPRQDASNIADNDDMYRARVQSLQAVDELVEGVISRLALYNLLDNTYIIYTTDNGYHIGQHRLQPGKECGFEEDINIPLIIRGPAVPRGVTSQSVSSHTDLAPTIMSLVGGKLRDDFDGAAIPVHENELESSQETRHEHVNVEYWGMALAEGKHGQTLHLNNTYKALRLVGKGYNLYYSVWCNNQHELCEMDHDPGQLNNLYSSSSSILLSMPLSKVVARLDALLLVLKSCKGAVCVKPWETLHADGSVKNLYDALSADFDSFYEAEQHRVGFSRCEAGYLVDAEGPQEALVYRAGVRWSEFV